jgi:hypothetical protein
MPPLQFAGFESQTYVRHRGRSRLPAGSVRLLIGKTPDPRILQLYSDDSLFSHLFFERKDNAYSFFLPIPVYLSFPCLFNRKSVCKEE